MLCCVAVGHLGHFCQKKKPYIWSRSRHTGPCRSGRKEGPGAGGEEAVNGSVLGEKFLFCCYLPLLLFLLVTWPSRLPHSF